MSTITVVFLAYHVLTCICHEHLHLASSLPLLPFLHSVAGLRTLKGGMLCVRSLESVSLDLRVALEDLEDLQEALSTKSLPATADNNNQLGANASKFFKGMRSIHLVCNTGMDFLIQFAAV